MKPVFHDVPQNTDEWECLRMFRFTASGINDLFMGKNTTGYKKAIYRVAYERATKEKPEGFSSYYMRRGHEMEPLAVDKYEAETFQTTSNGGFYSYGEWVGSSADRLIGNEGVLEIKSPAWNTMVEYLLKGELPPIYYWQVHSQMYASGRYYCDFMAFHPNLKTLIITIERDQRIMDEIEDKLNESINAVKAIIPKIKGNNYE